MKKPLTLSLVCFALFSTSAWIVFVLLDSPSELPAKSRSPYASFKTRSQGKKIGSSNTGRSVKVDRTPATGSTPPPRGASSVSGVPILAVQASPEELREWAELEFEFMMLTKPRTLDSKEFGGSMAAMAAFTARMLIDPSYRAKSQEGQRLGMEYKQTEDLQRKREILDKLRLYREDVMGIMRHELKSEQTSLGLTGTASGSSTGGAGNTPPPPPPEAPKLFQ